jgi:hypothetical protein
VVDRFEEKKRSEGGSPELSMAALTADWEPTVEARTGGRGGRRLGRGWVGWEFGGAGAALHGGSTMVAQWRSRGTEDGGG